MFFFCFFLGGGIKYFVQLLNSLRKLVYMSERIRCYWTIIGDYWENWTLRSVIPCTRLFSAFYRSLAREMSFPIATTRNIGSYYGRTIVTGIVYSPQSHDTLHWSHINKSIVSCYQTNILGTYLSHYNLFGF